MGIGKQYHFYREIEKEWVSESNITCLENSKEDWVSESNITCLEKREKEWESETK